MPLVILAVVVLVLVIIVKTLAGNGPQEAILDECHQHGYRVLGPIRQETYDWPKRYVVLCSDRDDQTRRVEFKVDQGGRVTMTSSEVVEPTPEGQASRPPVSPYERYDDPADQLSLRPGPVYPGVSFDETGESPTVESESPERHEGPPALPEDASSGHDLSELTRTLIEVSRSVRDLARRFDAMEDRLRTLEDSSPPEPSNREPDTSPPPTIKPPDAAAGDETIDPMT